jgi:CRP-like cAMP-binding protein
MRLDLQPLYQALEVVTRDSTSQGPEDSFQRPLELSAYRLVIAKKRGYIGHCQAYANAHSQSLKRTDETAGKVYVNKSHLTRFRPLGLGAVPANKTFVSFVNSAMAQTSMRLPMNRTQKLTSSDVDGNRIYNEILLNLPAEESGVIFPKLEFLRLKPHHLLHEVGDSLKSAYFCNTGIVSILSVFPDGEFVEVGLVGKEGFVGLPLIAGFQSASSRAVVQVETTVFRIEASALTTIMEQCPTLKRRLDQFSQMASVQVTQIAACNRLHGVDERLGRWLLMCAERVGPTELPLTQELLAQMLGTRRSSVTVAAGKLQKAGLIRYSRGTLDILDRHKLEGTACECYRLMQGQIQIWQQAAR